MARRPRTRDLRDGLRDTSEGVGRDVRISSAIPRIVDLDLSFSTCYGGSGQSVQADGSVQDP